MCCLTVRSVKATEAHTNVLYIYYPAFRPIGAGGLGASETGRHRASCMHRAYECMHPILQLRVSSSAGDLRGSNSWHAVSRYEVYTYIVLNYLLVVGFETRLSTYLTECDTYPTMHTVAVSRAASHAMAGMHSPLSIRVCVLFRSAISAIYQSFEPFTNRTIHKPGTCNASRTIRQSAVLGSGWFEPLSNQCVNSVTLTTIDMQSG